MNEHTEDPPVMARPAGNPFAERGTEPGAPRLEWAKVVRPTAAPVDHPAAPVDHTAPDRSGDAGPSTDEIPVVDLDALVETDPPAVHAPHETAPQVDHLPVIAGHVIDPELPGGGHYSPPRAPAMSRFLGRPLLDTPMVHMPRRMWATTCGATRATLYVTVHLYREVWPVLVGLRAVWDKVVWWLRGGYDGAMVRSEPDAHARQVAWSRTDRVRSRQWRRRIATVLLLLVIALYVSLPAQVDGHLSILGVESVTGHRLSLSAALRWLVVAALLVALDVAGRRILAERGKPAPSLRPPARPHSMIEDPSTTHRQFEATIIATLVDLGHHPELTTVTESWTSDPVSGESTVTISHGVALSATDLEAVATAVGARDDTLTTRKTGHVGVTQLRIRRRDVLAGTRTVRPRKPGGSGWDLFELGRSAGAVPLRLGFVGEHIAVVGTTGAGKSGFAELLFHHLTDREDVKVLAGDAVKGIVQQRWEDVLHDVAYREEQIEEMLAKVNAEIRRRSRILGEAARDLHKPATKWTPDMGPAWVVVLDELHALAGNKDIVTAIRTGIRTGKELGVSFVLLSQRLGAADLGDTSIRSMIGTTIMLPMREKDLQFVDIVREDIAAGWAPHMLKPSTPLGGPNDVGVCYIRSSFGHVDPTRYRLDAMPDAATLNRGIRNAAERAGTLRGPSMRATSDVDPGVETAEVIGGVVVDLGKRRGSSSHIRAEAIGEVPPIIAFLENVFDRSGDVEWLYVSDILDHARAAAGDPNHPHRAVARRIAEAKQPPQRLARMLTEAGAPGSRKRGGSGADRGKMVIDRLPRCTPVQDA